MSIESAPCIWKTAEQTCANRYVLPEVVYQIRQYYSETPIKILDIGCGNGFVDSELAQQGHSVTGVDSSIEGIGIARSTYHDVCFEVGSVYDEALVNVVGSPMDCVVSLEVIEHLFYPRMLFEQSHKLLRPGGHLIVSTPYHGYLKNLAISLLNRWDRHFGVDWEGGHIKFFSPATLERMALNAGFKNPRFRFVGRVPWLWKSMIMIVQK